MTFLGAQVAEKHPVVKGWQVAGRPAASTCKSRSVSEGKYSSVSEHPARVGLSRSIEGYKDSVALGAQRRFSDPIGFDRLRVSGSYSADDNLASDEKAARHGALASTATCTPGSTATRPTSTTCSVRRRVSRKGYSGRRPRPVAHLRPAARAELKADVAYYTDLDALPAFQNVAVTYDKLFTAGVELELQQRRAARSARGRRDRLQVVGGRPPLQCRRATGIPSLFGTVRLRLTAAARPFVALAEQRRRRLVGRSRQSARERVLRRLRQQLRGRRRGPSAIATCSACRGSTSTRSTAQSFVKSMLEWNLPPMRFEDAGTRRRSTRAGRGRPLFAAVAGDRSGRRRLPPTRTTTSARRWTSRSGAAAPADDALVRLRCRLRRRRHGATESSWRPSRSCDAARPGRATPMSPQVLAHAPVALLPVLVFLGGAGLLRQLQAREPALRPGGDGGRRRSRPASATS